MNGSNFKIHYRVPVQDPVSYTHLDVYKRQTLPYKTLLFLTLTLQNVGGRVAKMCEGENLEKSLSPLEY